MHLRKLYIHVVWLRFQTWACLAAAIIIMGPILYLVHKYSPSSTKMSGLNSSWQCVWYVYGALLQQGILSFSYFFLILTKDFVFSYNQEKVHIISYHIGDVFFVAIRNITNIFMEQLILQISNNF